MINYDLLLEEGDLLEQVEFYKLIENAIVNENTDETIEISMFNNKYDVRVRFRTYNKPITEKQNSAYNNFIKNQNTIIKKATTALLKYVKGIEDEVGYKLADSEKDLIKHVKPRTILVKNNGDVVLLLDCTWDVEHGIGILLYPNIKIAMQDIFI